MATDITECRPSKYTLLGKLVLNLYSYQYLKVLQVVDCNLSTRRASQFSLSPDTVNDYIKGDETDGTWSPHEGEKYIQQFDWKFSKEKTLWETWAEVRG
jgi:hypothetical protein